MTYQEAEFLLSRILPNPFNYNGHEHKAIIVPKLEKDFIKFLADIKTDNANLEDVKKYSTNNEYFIWSGNKVFHRL